MSYIGSTPTTQSFIAGTDYFNGNGSTTAFTLSRPVVSVNDIQAVVNNVVQVPNDAYNVSGTSIVFTSAPSAGTGNVYVRYLSTTTQSITPSQNTVSYATWDNDLRSETFAFKNRIINGDMVIDQRNAGASVTPVNAQYITDRWQCFLLAASKFTAQQNAGSVTPPAGFTNYLGITSTSAYSITSTDLFTITQPIEAFNTADLGWGTANASPVTLSFWVRSSLTGTFGGTLNNAANNYAYPFTYTISSANTWEYKTLTIAGPTAGTWLGATNGLGIRVQFGFGVGSTYSGTAGAWSAGNFYSATGATSVVGTNGATFYITGVQLEKGTTATNFDVLPYGTELSLCQRYYWRWSMDNAIQGTGLTVDATRAYSQRFALPVEMRTIPTMTFPVVGNTSGQITFLTANGSYPAGTSGTLSTDDLSPNGFNFNINLNSNSYTSGGSSLFWTTGASSIQASAEL